VPGIRKLEAAEHSRELLTALRDLHLRGGEPSVRMIARSTGRKISSDTVYRVLTGPGLPRWGPLELVVKALNGDVETFRDMWVSARRAMEQDSG
jgi:hypothetical protein